MMKPTLSRRSFLGLASASSLVTLAGCATRTYATSPSNRVLIVYFSCTGTTERMASYAAEATGADVYRIVPQEPYSEADIAYYTDCRADREQSDPTVRPLIAGSVETMAAYDTVILGHPIWHGQAPRIVSTFLESYDFAGKTVLPFCTSHSSGIGSSAAALQELSPEAVWLDGRRFGAEAGPAEVEEWLATSGAVELVAAGAAPSFDLETHLVTLNDGNVMPTNGLGTYSLKGQVCLDSVASALASGVRLIDTAYMYGNEAEVGRAIRESGVPREEVFVITKLYGDSA